MPRIGIGEKLTAWGGGATINPPGAANPHAGGQSNYTVQCELTPAQVFTVQFGIGPKEDPEGRNKPVALIEWAANGVTVYRKVSAINGMSISGVGEAVRVKVFDEGDSGAETPYPSTCIVSIGSRGGNAPPTLQNQDFVNLSTAGGTGSFTIEENVGIIAVRLLAVNDAGLKYDPDALTAIFRDGTGTLISGFQNFNVNGFVQVPPGAVSISVENEDAAVDVDVFPVFMIDG